MKQAQVGLCNRFYVVKWVTISLQIIGYIHEIRIDFDPLELQAGEIQKGQSRQVKQNKTDPEIDIVQNCGKLRRE